MPLRPYLSILNYLLLVSIFKYFLLFGDLAMRIDCGIISFLKFLTEGLCYSERIYNY